MLAAHTFIAPGAKPHCGINMLFDFKVLMKSVVSTSSVKSKYAIPSSAATVAIFLFTAKGAAEITASAPFKKSFTCLISLASNPSAISPCLKS